MADEPTIEELVDAHEKAKAVIEEAEAQQSVIKDAIMDYLKQHKISGIRTQTGYNVRRVVTTRYSKVPLSFAREVGAVKVEEKVDPTRLRAIAQQGIAIKGAEVVQYIKITEGR